MATFLNALLQAAPAPGAGGALLNLLPLGLIIAIFYFLILRPQNKKQKETEKMLAALAKGDKIITIGGIHGIIQSVKEGSVVVKVDNNTRLEFSRSAISSVIVEGDEQKEEKKSKKAKKISKDAGKKEEESAQED